MEFHSKFESIEAYFNSNRIVFEFLPAFEYFFFLYAEYALGIIDW